MEHQDERQVGLLLAFTQVQQLHANADLMHVTNERRRRATRLQGFGLDPGSMWAFDCNIGISIS